MNTTTLIPDNLRDYAAALIRDLEADGRAVCKLMAYHLWLMTTTDTPDDAALYEDVIAMADYLGKGS